jgi:hypothetical protein
VTDIRKVFYSTDEEDYVPRLLLFAKQELGVARDDAPGLVVQAIEEALLGKHHHHFHRHTPVFRFLCAVLESLVTAQRELKSGTN